MIQMTKPPNRRLAIDAPRRADPLVEIARPCPTAAAMRFSAPSTRRAQKDRAPNDSGAGPTGGARVRGVAFGAAPGSGGKARFGLALDWTDEPADRPAPPPQPPPREPAAAFRRYVDRDRDGARPWRGADARSAYVPLARLRLAQSSRSPARGRPRARQRVGWRSPTRSTIERGGISPRRDSPHRPPARLETSSIRTAPSRPLTAWSTRRPELGADANAERSRRRGQTNDTAARLGARLRTTATATSFRRLRRAATRLS